MEETFYIYGSEDVKLIYRFNTIDIKIPMGSWQKLTSWSKNLYEKAKDPEKPK